MKISRPIILASKSPRRQELLKMLNIKFKIASIDIQESYPNRLKPTEIATYLALKKANAFKKKINDEIIITADTIVVADGKILGKPKKHTDAFKMLKLLSNNKHKVITSVCLRSKHQIKTFFETTLVYFNKLTDDQINDYIRNCKPYDKAGAYAIQEWIGLTGIKKIEGCYYNVVGFPVAKFVKEFQKFILSEEKIYD